IVRCGGAGAVWRQPTRVAGDCARGAGARGAPRTRLRAAHRRAGHHPGRAAAPAGAQLRRAGGRHTRRPRGGPGAAGCARAHRRPAAGRHPPYPGAAPADGNDGMTDPAATGPGPPGRSMLNRLQLLVTRRLDGLLQGEYLGLLPGAGTELGESREYQAGDDVRRMDWPVTARTTVPHVRQTEADRELETWLAVDL